jgi:phosphoribosylanthranilate isomerase
VESVLKSTQHQHTYVGWVAAHPSEGCYADVMKSSSAVTVQVHTPQEQAAALSCRARLAAPEAKNEHTNKEETNKLIENEFDKMSVISFEMVEDEVMGGGLNRDGDTNDKEQSAARNTSNNSDVMEAPTTTNN